LHLLNLSDFNMYFIWFKIIIYSRLKFYSIDLSLWNLWRHTLIHSIKKNVFTKNYTNHIYSTTEHNVTITNRVNKNFTYIRVYIYIYIYIYVDDIRHFFTVSRSKNKFISNIAIWIFKLCFRYLLTTICATIYLTKCYRQYIPQFLGFKI